MEYKVEVNLNGPDGNAFALMRKAKYLGVKLDLSKDEIDSIVKEMMSGDYDNLVEVFTQILNFSDKIVSIHLTLLQTCSCNHKVEYL